MGVIRLTEDMFKAKEETLPDFDKSIFKDCYVQASDVLLEIVKNNSGAKHESINQSVEYHNNIIAFSGERGSGKTSSMVSFHNSLKCELDSINSLEDNSDFKKRYQELKEYHFHLPYIIDPSVLTHKDSIIEIIVGRMFEEVRNEPHYDDVASKRNLIQKFEKVFKNLRIINAEPNSIFEQNHDNLEVLMDMASVVDLRDNLYQLFHCYLEYMNRKGSKKDKYLVIAIDDLDMNMASADRMLEEIRKYLIIPNVVIFIALRMPQMEQVVKQRNMMQLKETTDFYYKLDKINKSDEYLNRHYYDINTKMHKYLDKIFPETHVVDMPYIWSENTEITFKIGNKDKKDKISDFIKILFKYNIGYVIGTDIHLRTILPQNLRGFIELVELLDYKTTYNLIDTTKGLQKENTRKGVKTIQKYYKEKFLMRVNNTEQRNILVAIMEEDITVLNKKLLLNLVDLLYKKYDLSKEKEDKEKSENERIDDTLDYIQTIYKNRRSIEKTSVNIGDILCLLKIYEQSELDTNEQMFYELFKLFYTMKFIEFVSSLDPTKDSDKETYNGFVYDMVGRYFYIVNSKNSIHKSYFRTPIKINSKIDFDDIVKDKEKYINMFYDFLQPVYGKNPNVKLKITKKINEAEMREIVDENKVSKLTTNTVVNDDNELQSLYNYRYFYYEPIRIFKPSLELNKIEEKEINLNYFKLVNIDWFMNFLKEFLFSIKNTGKLSNNEERIQVMIERLVKITQEKYDESFIFEDFKFISQKVDKFTIIEVVDSYRSFEDNCLPSIKKIRELISNYKKTIQNSIFYEDICTEKSIASTSINKLIKQIDSLNVNEFDNFDEIRKLIKELKLMGLRKDSWEKNKDYKNILIGDIDEKQEKIQKIEKMFGNSNVK